MLATYARCDVKNAKSLLPDVPDSLANKFLGAAEGYLQAGDYLGAITYATAAVAFQDQLSRDTYEELTKVDAPLPVCG
jgi:hypothetical protein